MAFLETSYLDLMTKKQNTPVRIAMWSTPRSLSTALMRSWENRPDTVVIDEPLHGVDLVLGNWQFEGKETTLAHYEADWNKVVQNLLGPIPEGKTVYYQKHMALQIIHEEITLDWIYGLVNCFLIREPKEVISSYLKKWPNIKGNLGFPQLLKLFKLVKAHTGKIPPVIDARDLQNQPKRTLTRLCERIDVPFFESMLLWNKGIRATDGPWTTRGWYDNVASSTGFRPYRKKDITIRAEYEELCVECETVYQELKRFKL